MTFLLQPLDVVLTAAHCFDNGRIVRYVNIGPTLSFVQQEYIEVDSITIHPRYNKDSPTRDYDFAILKLKDHSKATPASINLDTNFPLLAGTPLESIGFGADEDGEPTEILKRVDLDFVPFGICQQNFFPDISPNLHDCAEGFPPEDAPCDGRSLLRFNLICWSCLFEIGP
jgi:secreted trypsin-like serine protease